MRRCQVVERGYTVKEVAERLGISEAILFHSLSSQSQHDRFLCLRPTPSRDDGRAEELLEAKRENLTLRAELRRTQEERDILKEAAAYFARGPE